MRKSSNFSHFWQIQKNQLNDLKQHLERYVNTLPAFGFNSDRYDLVLIMSYCIPYLIRDKEQDTSVIKKAKDFISFKLPNLANICPQKSANYKFYPFCEGDKDLCEKIREDMTGGPSIVFTRKAVVDETFIRNASNVCNSIVGIDASQLYPFSMGRDMPTTLYPRWEFDADMQNFKARHKRALRIWACLYTRKQDRKEKLRAFIHLENSKKLTVLMWTVILITVRQCSKQSVVTTASVLSDKLVPP